MQGDHRPPPGASLDFGALLAPAIGAAVREALSAGRPDPPPLDPEQLLTPQQVAELLAVSISRARQLMQGELPVVTLPAGGAAERLQRRCRRADLLAWIAERRKEAL